MHSQSSAPGHTHSPEAACEAASKVPPITCATVSRSSPLRAPAALADPLEVLGDGQNGLGRHVDVLA